MSVKKKKKKQVFPIVEAHKIAFTDQPPEAYYNEEEQRELQQQKNMLKYSPAKKISKRDKDSSDSLSSDSESEQSSVDQKQPKKQPRKSKPKPKSKPKNRTNNIEESKENKGILSKMADTAKEIVSTKEKKPEPKTDYIIELPRDILTAFFLLRLPRDDSRVRVKPGQCFEPYWNDYTLYGKVFLWISVLMPYGIQWFVLGVLLQELATKWDELKEVDAGGDFWYNTVAFAVLFLYMWRDLAQFYFSVWFYIGWLQKNHGGILSNIKTAASATGDLAKSLTNNADGSAQDNVEEAKEATADAVRFIEFRIWLLSVLFLYFGLTCFSLLSIPLEDGLINKLEISLSVFFILEVDDWAYELFIAQANILDDEEFDVNVFVKKDRAGVVQAQQKHLAITVVLVISSIVGFWILGWGLNQI